MRRICDVEFESSQMERLDFEFSGRIDPPILEVSKARCRARVTGDEDDCRDWDSRGKELLRCDDGADGVGAKMEVEICK